MSVSTGLHFDQCDDTVWLQITDGESFVSFEVRDPLWDWPNHCAIADLLVNGEVWRLVISPGLQLEVVRPGGIATPPREELLRRLGHPMSEGVSHG